MLHKVVQVRLYPSLEQQIQLAQTFGCARWWWNYALNKSIETYKETGKGLSRVALNAFLPTLKKAEETVWLANCYSQVLQATTLNLTTAYKNFFEKRAGFPKFKSKRALQSIQYPQNFKIVDGNVKLPGNIGIVKAKIHRAIEGKVKTVTVSKTPSGKYLASILTEIEGENPVISEGKIYGIDLGLKHFAVVTDGEKVSKYDNPKHLAKHEFNLKRKQKKLARKQKGSKSRNKYRKVVAKVYERVSNSRQDFLHKLSYKLVSDSQAVIVENLHVKGMIRNHKLAKAISDLGWGTFTNFLAYKLERKGGKLIEIDRWFPSSKLCSNCFYQIGEMLLDIREWNCPNCGTHHDRDANAAQNIRAEGIRMLGLNAAEMIKAEGSAVSAVGGEVSPALGRKSKFRHSPMITEAPTSTVLGKLG
ncbi:IS200/IS605 family element transposase accessory protein TnpB [Nostoc sp. UCD121]|uniref:RNA-guided endonuclease InsQ/TnpB family protein n=2 Tax=Nostoc TaxID=1177 RepID=UPI001625A5B1|nr:MULTISPECIES: RNA-guided endonuclease TnpB family protein [unclassified Nostoc]MBC1220882.1 IS200/IS605 family element transposase accessory protein TnpB [Nostoc sp. UCD120]MBC1277278.1 IS200/IS605 family element transposase accessory protein TnpB [Nostoc sp. UCD121]MBC1294221.1 IS200/IS605 family element transposase accessory protein TnpB [Nostoc sp. UCD122]